MHPIQVKSQIENLDYFWGMEFNETGSLLALVGRDAECKRTVCAMFDISSGRLIDAMWTDEVPKDFLYIQFLPDCAKLTTRNKEFSFCLSELLWQKNSINKIHPISLLFNEYEDPSVLDINPQKQLCIIVERTTPASFNVWNYHTNELIAEFPDALTEEVDKDFPHEFELFTELRCLAMSPDGSLVAGSTLDEIVTLWRIPGGATSKIGKVDLHRQSKLWSARLSEEIKLEEWGFIKNIVFTKDGSKIVFHRSNSSVEIWNIAHSRREFKEVMDIPMLEIAINQKNQIAAASADGAIYLISQPQ